MFGKTNTMVTSRVSKHAKIINLVESLISC